MEMPRNLSHESAGSSTGLTAWMLKNCDLVADIPPTSISADDDVDILVTHLMLERSGRNSKPRTRS